MYFGPEGGEAVAYKRADDGLRTRDLQLGKLALYQLSYVRVRGHSTMPGVLRWSWTKVPRKGIFVRILRHLLAGFLLPGVVTIVVPAEIIRRTGTLNVGWGLTPPLGWLPWLLGCGLIGFGLLLMYRTISLFASFGEGTLAPWDPPRRLVVRGVYRRVRNPMISGVFSVLLGEAALLGSPPVLLWFLIVFAVNALYIPLIEERSLSERFGEEYLDYRRNVPRWIPRPGPWTQGSDRRS
jgi:protein-S-isoprenylcysteine O-methyltransferase Ste14